MRVELRTPKNSKPYYSFVYWDGEKRIRLKKSEHPQFESRKEAEEWAKSKEAEISSAKSRILRKLKWKTQYYDLAKLCEQYVEYSKRTQPNSWKNSKFYLEQYVVYYFSDIKKVNNFNNWALYFEDFRNWLEEEAITTKIDKKPISYSSKNHCIKALNTFLEYLKINNHVDPANIYKMKAFPSSKVNNRDAEALITHEEFQNIYKLLKESNPTVATFFETAYWTGMRFNEIFGLSLDELFIGGLEDGVLKEALEDHNMSCFGYIVLESQPADKARIRQEDGSIKRKPLKGKPKISEKYNRLIPLLDKNHFNNLVRLYKIQEENLENKKYGTSRKDYVLFDNVTHSKLVTELRKAYAQTKYTPKSYHCCRHTRCTELVGKTRDFVLARYWLGHARQETTLRYTHIYQQSVRAAKKKSQQIDFID